MKVLTPEQVEFYNEHGYVIVEDFLKRPALDSLLGALDRLVEEKARGLDQDREGFNVQRTGDEAGNFANDGKLVQPGLLRKIQEITKYSSEFAALAESPALLDVVEDLIGPTIYYHSSKIMFKPARHGTPKPWHQDYAYWASLKPEQVTCWLALDDATIENGCMQVIPGSHKWGLLKHGQKELQVDRRNLPLDRVKVAEMKAGSLLAFHVLTFHYSGANTSEKDRRSFIVDYDPNRRPVKEGFAGDRLLRIGGRAPTPEQILAEQSAVAAVTA
ncbi:MAG: phytanoyl-CoA dioxygenase family protein [Planctomycetes bacterium]|nr:phytanoyl-CoA dioxygenase family protein [Planctomycetota bacterium]